MLSRHTSVTIVTQEHCTNALMQLFILYITQIHQCSYSFLTLYKYTNIVIRSSHCTNTSVQLFISYITQIHQCSYSFFTLHKCISIVIHSSYTNIFSFTDSTQEAIMYLKQVIFHPRS